MKEAWDFKLGTKWDHNIKGIYLVEAAIFFMDYFTFKVFL